MAQQVEKGKARELMKILDEETQILRIKDVIEALDKERQELFREDYRATQRQIDNVAKCLILSNTMPTENNSRKIKAHCYFSRVKATSKELFVLSAFASYKNTGTTFGKVNKKVHTSAILNWWEAAAHPPALKQLCDKFFPIPETRVPAVSSIHDVQSLLSLPREDLSSLPDFANPQNLPSPNSTISSQTNAGELELRSTPGQDHRQIIPQSPLSNGRTQQDMVERPPKRRYASTDCISLEHSITESLDPELPIVVQYPVASPFEFNETEINSEDRRQLHHTTQQHSGFSRIMIQKMLEHLNVLSRRVWDVSLDESAAILRQKASDLSAQIAVHQTLESTARYLSQLPEPTSVLNIQSKVTELMNVVYRNLACDENEVRWQKLRDMDCAAFLFIGLSYTPSDVIKMPQAEFDYLTGNVSKFQQVKVLPQKWIFRKEIHLAIASTADLPGAASFRRKYYALEFDLEELRVVGSAGYR